MDADFWGRIWFYLSAFPAAVAGIVADRFFFGWEKPYCLATGLILTLIVIPAIAWIRDLARMWLRAAVGKEMNWVFRIVPAKKWLAMNSLISRWIKT